MAGAGFRIELSSQAGRKINDAANRIEGGLGRRGFKRELAKELLRLGSAPQSLSRKLPFEGKLDGQMGYSFRINALPLTWEFTVSFVYGDDEQSLVVTDFGVLNDGELLDL